MVPTESHPLKHIDFPSLQVPFSGREKRGGGSLGDEKLLSGYDWMQQCSTVAWEFCVTHPRSLCFKTKGDQADIEEEGKA